MDLLTFARSGAELRSGAASRTIDFAVKSSESLLVLFCGWDLSDNLSPGLDGDLYQIEGIPVQDASGDFVSSFGETITTHGDESGAIVFSNCRDRIRCRKTRYMDMLRALSLSVGPAFDFSDVLTYFGSLAPITPTQTLEHTRRKREVVGVVATNYDDAPVDALVLDEDGAIAVFSDGGPLSRAVSVIQTTPGLNNPAAARQFLLAWNPQGVRLREPKITQASGSIDDLALRFFEDIV